MGAVGLRSRYVLVSAAVLVCASQAFAQGTSTLVGTIIDTENKQPLVDAVVTVTGLKLQGEQYAVTDATGVYRIPNLPAGSFQLRVEKEGYRPFTRSDVTLRLDWTTRADVNLLPNALKAEEIVVEAKSPAIDVGSSSTGVNINENHVRNLPIAPPGGKGSASRSVESLAELAPGAFFDLYGVSLGGATSPENLYVIDGVSVNNPGFGTLGTPLNMEFVQEANVITGGFMPEYGRSTGGVLNVVTKSGSNEFHGSVFGTWSPGAFSGPARAIAREGGTISTEKKLWNLGDFGADLSGPIIKDRLWFYVGVAPSVQRQALIRNLNQTQLCEAVDPDTGCMNVGDPLKDSAGNTVTTPIPGTNARYFADTFAVQYIGKLTLAVTPNHHLTVSAYGSPGRSGGPGRFGIDPNSDKNDLELFNQGNMIGSVDRLAHAYDFSSNDVGVRWSSAFLDKHVLFDAIGGWHHQESTMGPSDRSKIGSDQGLAGVSAVEWTKYPPRSILAFENIPDPSYCDPADADNAVKCPVTDYWTGGPDYLEAQKMNRYQVKLVGTGLFSALGHHVAKVGLDIEALDYQRIKAYSGTTRYYELYDFGIFLDGRQFGFLTGPDQAVIQKTSPTKSSSNTVGFFVQDSWSIMDLVTLNAGVRYDAQTLAGDDGKTALNLPRQWSPRIGVNYDFTRKGKSKLYANYAKYYESVPLDIIDRNFPGDRLLFSAHDAATCDPKDPAQQMNECQLPSNRPPLGNWFYGAHDPNQTYFEASGLEKILVDPNLQAQSTSEIVVGGEYEFIADSVAGVQYTKRWVDNIIEDMSADEANSFFVGNPGSGLARNFPKATRNYDALNVYFMKAFSGAWLLQASYTLSWLHGNWAGLYRPETGQLDPNMNTDFDLRALTVNRTGMLPGDRTHQLKLMGAKEINFSGGVSLTVGGSYRGSSGSPLSHLAFSAHPSYTVGEVFVLPRGSAGRGDFIHNIDTHLAVKFKLDKEQSIAFGFDCFNIFNFQSAVAYDQNYALAPIAPIEGGTTAQLETDLKNPDGTPFDKATLNKNFLKPTAYQAPRSFRFLVRGTF